MVVRPKSRAIFGVQNQTMKKSIALVFAVGTLFVAGCCATHPVTKWEYKQIQGGQTEESLNKLADDGWTIVGLSTYGGYLLKRAKR